MGIVRAIESCVLTVEGSPTPIRANDQFDDDDIVVRTHPAAFRRDSDIEQATAAPGERRNVRRP